MDWRTATRLATLDWVESIIVCRVATFRRLNRKRLALLSEAAICLLFAKVIVRVVPFSRMAPHLGVFMRPTDSPAASERAPASDVHAELAGQIGWAVSRAARVVPFPAVCLPQAIAARLMLDRRRISSVLRLGAAKGAQKPLDAHAWLDAAGVHVTGYPLQIGLAEVACFVWDADAAPTGRTTPRRLFRRGQA